MNKFHKVLLILAIIIGVFYFYDFLLRSHYLSNVHFNVVYQELDQCLVFSNNTKFDKLVINSDTEIYSFLEQLHEKQSVSCSELVMPNFKNTVNFDLNTIIGTYTQSSCAAEFIRNVQRNDRTKTVTYFIKTVQHTCPSGAPRRSLNLIAVPKIPSDYKIQIKK